jgi:hypothetical protein
MGKLLENTSYNNPLTHLWNHHSIQQDTIPKVQPKDTTEAIPEGINPLFLMIERKSREVEAIKEQVEQPKPAVLRRPVVANVDTTCYICRDKEYTPLHAVVSGGEQSPLPLVGSTLYDVEYYNEFVNLNQQVFIETQPSKPTGKITIKPLERSEINAPWLFFPMVAMLILLAFLKIFFSKELREVFRSALFFHIGKKITRENPIVLNRFFRVLDIATLISLPVAIVQITNLIDYPDYGNIDTTKLILYILIGLTIFRAFRFFSLKIIGFVSNQAVAIDLLHINQLIYTRLLGVILIPLNLLMLYAAGSARMAFVYITLSALAIIMIYRGVRIVQVFLFNGFSMFYLFLYLCALEIIPILIIISEIF